MDSLQSPLLWIYFLKQECQFLEDAPDYLAIEQKYCVENEQD